MKKTLIPLLALASAGAVWAQSSVTLYGVVDAGLTHTSNSGGGQNFTGVKSGGTATSRWGFRGTEDLGGGLKAKFLVETAVPVDEPKPTTLGDRGAWVGLESRFGELRLGREFDQAFSNQTNFSAFGTNGVGSTLIHDARSAAYKAALGASPAVENNIIWSNNAITYILPNTLGGFYGTFQHALAEKTAPGNEAGRSTNFRIGYKGGPLDVGVGYNKTDGGTSAASTTIGTITSTNLGASYDFGVAKVFAAWAQDKTRTTATGTETSQLTGWDLGASIPVSAAGKVLVSYAAIKTETVGDALDDKASKWALGYRHSLSKRTTVYATVARLSNKNGAQLNIGGTAAVNGSSTGYDVGVSHSF